MSDPKEEGRSVLLTPSITVIADAEGRVFIQTMAPISFAMDIPNTRGLAKSLMDAADAAEQALHANAVKQ